MCVARARLGLCCWPGLCLALGTLGGLCLELLLCREEGRQSILPSV